MANGIRPVTRLSNISSVPYLKIYDKDGSLVAEGRSARTWLQQAMAQSSGTSETVFVRGLPPHCAVRLASQVSISV